MSDSFAIPTDADLFHYCFNILLYCISKEEIHNLSPQFAQDVLRLMENYKTIRLIVKKEIDKKDSGKRQEIKEKEIDIEEIIRMIFKK